MFIVDYQAMEILTSLSLVSPLSSVLQYVSEIWIM